MAKKRGKSPAKPATRTRAPEKATSSPRPTSAPSAPPPNPPGPPGAPPATPSGDGPPQPVPAFDGYGRAPQFVVPPGWGNPDPSEPRRPLPAPGSREADLEEVAERWGIPPAPEGNSQGDPWHLAREARNYIERARDPIEPRPFALLVQGWLSTQGISGWWSPRRKEGLIARRRLLFALEKRADPATLDEGARWFAGVIVERDLPLPRTEGDLLRYVLPPPEGCAPRPTSAAIELLPLPADPVGTKGAPPATSGLDQGQAPPVGPVAPFVVRITFKPVSTPDGDVSEALHVNGTLVDDPGGKTRRRPWTHAKGEVRALAALARNEPAPITESQTRKLRALLRDRCGVEAERNDHGLLELKGPQGQAVRVVLDSGD